MCLPNSSIGRRTDSFIETPKHNVRPLPFQIIRKITGAKLIGKFRVRIYHLLLAQKRGDIPVT